MKTLHILLLAAASAVGANAQAQEKVWRCANNEYTNNAAIAQQRGCKVMEGGNVTVVQGTRPVVASRGSSGPAVQAPPGSPKVDGADQRARDGDARSVLEAELKKTNDRCAQLKTEYNNGEPEKQGSESKNYQKYLDRVADMKAELARCESDSAGISREIGRMTSSR